jgi:hypothetical protein
MQVYRKVIAGPYAGMTVSFIARLVGADRHKVKSALVKFFRAPENRGKESDENSIGRFIQTFRNTSEEHHWTDDCDIDDFIAL